MSASPTLATLLGRWQIMQVRPLEDAVYVQWIPRKGLGWLLGRKRRGYVRGPDGRWTHFTGRRPSWALEWWLLQHLECHHVNIHQKVWTAQRPTFKERQ